MSADINIKRIANIFYTKTNTWSRDYFDIRFYDGIVLFDEGEIEYTFADKKIHAKKGDFLFLPGNIPYSGKKLTEYVAFYVIDFECFSSNEFLNTIDATVLPSYEYEIFSKKFSQLVELWKKQYIDINFKVKSFIYQVLCDAIRCDNKPKIPTDIILDYIYENICDPSLSIKILCDIFFISESQLRRNIHKRTGMNPNDYILKLRLNKAKSELVNSSKTIGEIAESCGFSSQYYFSKCFSENEGIAPSKYRLLTSL